SAIVLGHRSSQIVVNDLTRDTTQSEEGMHVTADESLKALAVRELQKQHAAVSIDESEGIELALVAGIIQHAEVPPIDLETLAGCWLHVNEGAIRFGFGASLFDVIAQDGVAAGI